VSMGFEIIKGKGKRKFIPAVGSGILGGGTKEKDSNGGASTSS